jgi:hypothetical protein
MSKLCNSLYTYQDAIILKTMTEAVATTVSIDELYFSTAGYKSMMCRKNATILIYKVTQLYCTLLPTQAQTLNEKFTRTRMPWTNSHDLEKLKP